MGIEVIVGVTFGAIFGALSSMITSVLKRRSEKDDDFRQDFLELTRVYREEFSYQKEVAAEWNSKFLALQAEMDKQKQELQRHQFLLYRIGKQLGLEISKHDTLEAWETEFLHWLEEN